MRWLRSRVPSLFDANDLVTNCDHMESDRRALCQRDPLVAIDRWEELLEMSKGCSRLCEPTGAGWLDLPLLLSV